MTQSDFNVVPINHTFTEGSPVIEVEFPIEGNLDPVGPAMLLLQVAGVNSYGHDAFINNKQIGDPGFLSPAPGASQALQLRMERIPGGVLKKGNNNLRIQRGAPDDFIVYTTVVYWREPSGGGLQLPGGGVTLNTPSSMNR